MNYTEDLSPKKKIIIETEENMLTYSFKQVIGNLFGKQRLRKSISQGGFGN